MSETIGELRNKFKKSKEAFQSKDFKGNIDNARIIVSGVIITDEFLLQKFTQVGSVAIA